MTNRTILLLRSLPFFVLAALSIRAAAEAPRGRRPFSIDMAITARGLVEAATKFPHIRTCAALFMLATLAVGARRLALAFWLTMLIGASWEIVEATGISRNSRLLDLVPDVIGALGSLLLMLAIRTLVNVVLTLRTTRPRRT